MMAPEGVVPVATNLLFDRLAPNVPNADLRGAIHEVDRFGLDAVVLDAAGIAYSSASFDQDVVVAELQASASAPIVLDVAAVVDALHELGAQRVAIAAPYDETVGRIMAEYFARHGFEVVGLALAGFASVADVRSAAPDLAWQLAGQAIVSARGADAVYLASSEWSAAPYLQRLETERGIPAVCNSQASLWRVLTSLRLPQAKPGFGRLLAGAGGTTPGRTADGLVTLGMGKVPPAP